MLLVVVLIFLWLSSLKKGHHVGNESSNQYLMAIQVHHYDESKRPYMSVHSDVNSRKRYIYGCKRAVNRPFGSDCITAVFRRAVYDETQRRLQKFSSRITAVFCRTPPYTAMFTSLLRHFPLD
jgi:hypothetical protein